MMGPLTLCSKSCHTHHAGAYLLKFGRSGRPQKRFVRVTDEGDALYWVSRRKKRADSTREWPTSHATLHSHCAARSSRSLSYLLCFNTLFSAVYFAYVDRLQRGQHTSTFARHAKGFGHLSPLCLSIVAAGGFRSLDLAFESPEQLDTWTVALTALLLRQRAGGGGEDSETKQLWRAFAAEDALGGGHGSLTYAQCKALLRRMNVYQQKKRLKALFRAVTAASIISAAGASIGAGSDGSSSQFPDSAPSASASFDSGAAAATALPAEPPTVPAVTVTSSGATAADGLSFQAFLRLVDLLRDRPDITAVYNSLLHSYSFRRFDGGADDAIDGCSGHADVTASATAAGTDGTAAGTAAAASSSTAASGPLLPPLMPVSVFHSFLVHDQKEAGTTLEQAIRIAAHYDPSNRGGYLSLSAFTAYLTSASNSAFAPETGRVGWHDMSQPLSHYFIESSHNTYLEGDQVQGAASVSAYISVVQKGCRCVELDCWDGPAGEPVIYHGHTLTGRVLFSDVCRALREYGFVASPFPLILSLEVHCSPKQQERMAAILQETFGSSLAAPLTLSAAAGAGGGGSGGGTVATTGGVSVGPSSVSGGSSRSLLSVGSSVTDAVTADPTVVDAAAVGSRHGHTLSAFSAASGIAPPSQSIEPAVMTTGSGASGSSSDTIGGGGLVLRAPAPAVVSGGGGESDGTAAAVCWDAASVASLTSIASSAGGADSAAVSTSLPALSMNLDCLPSPLDLLRKIVVKAKVAKRLKPVASAVVAAVALSSAVAAAPGAGTGTGLTSTHGSPRHDPLVSAPPAGGTSSGGSNSAGMVPPFNLGGDDVTPAITTSSPSAPVAHAQAPHSFVRSVLPPSGGAVSSATTDAASSASVPSAPASPRTGDLHIMPLLSEDAAPSLSQLPSIYSYASPPRVNQRPSEPAPSSPGLSLGLISRGAVISQPPSPRLQAAAVPSASTIDDVATPPPTSVTKARSRAGSAASATASAAASIISRVGRKLSLGGSGSGAVTPLPASFGTSPASDPTPDMATGAATVAVSTDAGDSATAAAPLKLELLVPPLRSLVMLAALPFESLEQCVTSGEKAWHMHSLKEPKAAKLLAKSGPGPVLLHTTRQLMRVYPGPLRLNSSNFHGGPYWAAGVQMVALNHQTHDVAMRVTRAFFRLNGRCGYVLKPAYMRSENAIIAMSSQGLSASTGAALPPPKAPLNPLSSPLYERTLTAGERAQLTSALSLHASATDVLHSSQRFGPGVYKEHAPSHEDATGPFETQSKWLQGNAGQTLFTLPTDGQTNFLQRTLTGCSLKRTLSGVWQQQRELPSPILVRAMDASPDAMTFVVTVMGAQHLPRRGAGEAAGVPSPYCTVGIHGDPCDRIKFSTRGIADNGFNPVWSEQFRFKLAKPEIAVLYIAVHDQLDVARKGFLAYFAVPLSAVRPGYRSCQLRNAVGKKIPLCSLLCRFQRR